MSEANERNRKIIEEFRANSGRVGGRFEGKNLVLLHTEGAKTKRERVNPLVTVKDDGRYVVIASKGGAPTHPDWYHNIVANPFVTLETGKETIQARAAVAAEPERTRLYNKMVEMMPAFDTYRRNTKRQIPVIVLTPVK